MGGLKSIPSSDTQPSELNNEFDKEWRKMPWGKNCEIEQKLRDFKLKHPSVRFVRILLIGDAGAGKSSFINSVNNVFQKRITSDALTNTTGGKSFTKTYQTYYIEGKDGSHLPFAFNDVMGLEERESGASSHDIIKALSGLLQDGFNFDLTSSKSMKDPGYRNNPSLEDEPCCLVNIIDANSISRMEIGVINKMNKIREAASKLNMRQVIIMTKPDLACPLVHQDIRKIYTSKKIKEKMQECSNLLGIPMNHVFPVKNYHEEIDPDDDMDLLILKALDQIVHIAADKFKEQSFKSGDKPE
ncbi:hypothetical protein KOW79_020451 [Hemibagrus wyckioides]|uniref:Interferon-induced protein 44-like n=1 Tax=Hemibagrus wyckioides TaxID=337641 RepID=A0A9D3N6W1_9TELE|nr:interferon-induced protein 44-like [Hemibagrus wyckioides]XP_058236447.1 interferon-induced protein 44-like [Hemibagrus wyckioides]XP_058236448.1 interferon-induced protein 44-like [Hemibagrus wyckioides]XP_058236449.1 interferon-induced protein 44-like [Hemibagrus wyckioides]XP_058236450.1 interferon-induced protein 44-like [Hemibagrus wyckioides]XP_058236451.1 interferon-induced protein 44-like [Hemibagrus wyckioides]XP_058236452.1 interferon-induced protein 44-like [Hemibagrus wyckioide